MRKINNANATENKNRQSQNTTAATEQKTTAANAGKAKANEKATEKKALRWADLTEEQQNLGKSFLWIMERREWNGVRQLEIDKTADPVIIRAAEGLDEKATLRATGRISTSARRVLGGKYDADSHAYSFPRKEFVKWVAYYKAAVAEGITTLDSTKEQPEKAKTEKPQTDDKKPSDKPKNEGKKPKADDTLITKAEALARCRKFLAQQVFTKAMMECIEDELKALFA